MPLAWAVLPDPLFLTLCFGAVTGGAVFGDQCSPISDTTILSSLVSGCDLMDHVLTQLPPALTAAALAALAYTLAALVVV
jgi:Na+/H+ antiporter NhaC